MPTRNVGLATALLALRLAPAVLAHYSGPELEQVPIERLIGNLERMANDEPRNFQLLVNLERAHAMAFANGGADVQVPTAKWIQLGHAYAVWFGPEAKGVPFSTESGLGRPVTDAQRAHLTVAIAAYERALVLDPRNGVARLGYGWCLEQAGDRLRAADTYRRVIAEQWPSAQPFVSEAGLVTQEAIGYLMPHLDPVRDKVEIDRLRGYLDEFAKTPRFMSPVVIPLAADRDVSQLVDRSAHVHFDADGSALDREWSWISKDAGWLVYDQLGTRKITSALQLFGNVTFWMFWENGYEALRALDDNGDGRLAGGELAHLAIWRDSNSNGTSEAGEVKPLAEWGIVQLSTAYEPEDEGDVYIASSRAGVTFADGSTRATYDVLLHRK
jgi:tetratricopeptide (TPR) repeat protein